MINNMIIGQVIIGLPVAYDNGQEQINREVEKMEYAIKRKSDGTLWTSTIDNSIVRFKTLKEAYAYAIRMNLTYDEFEIVDF